jgi:hypothetical protein
MRGAILGLAIVMAFVLIAGDALRTPAPRAQGGPTCFLPLIMGDLSGNRAVWANDALWVLRDVANLYLPGPGCSPVDVDCDGRESAIDALKILRYVAGLQVSQTDPCIAIGDEIPA